MCEFKNLHAGWGNFGKWPEAGFFPVANLQILSDWKVEISGKSHPASPPIFGGEGGARVKSTQNYVI